MEAHDRARDIYRANIEEIGHHLGKSSHILVAVERHDADDVDLNALPKDRFLWVKARRVSCAIGLIALQPRQLSQLTTLPRKP